MATTQPEPTSASSARPLLVVMGVSGCGKSTAAEAIASRVGVRYADGDGFHPDTNLAKMRAGTPLTDDDRWPWLDEIGAWLATYSDEGAVVACSALRRAYRDRLRAAAPRTSFLHLAGPQEVVQRRLDARSDHFMPPSLLQSQYDTLEPLYDDEAGVTIDLDLPVPVIVEQYLSQEAQ
jgi:gluconokinase